MDYIQKKINEVMNGLIDLCGSANIEPRKQDLYEFIVQTIEKFTKCEHDFQVLDHNYYKDEPGNTAYSMLYCTKCGITKEVVSRLFKEQ